MRKISGYIIFFLNFHWLNRLNSMLVDIVDCWLTATRPTKSGQNLLFNNRWFMILPSPYYSHYYIRAMLDAPNIASKQFSYQFKYFDMQVVEVRRDSREILRIRRYLYVLLVEWLTLRSLLSDFSDACMVRHHFIYFAVRSWIRF